MRASELKPGQVARTDRHVYVADDEGVTVVCCFRSVQFYEWNNIPSGFIHFTVTPLAPETPISELQRYANVYDGYSYSTVMADYGAYVRFSDLKSVALTKEADAEQVAKLQVKLEAAEDRADFLSAENVGYKAELATLREQYVLGEPCKYHDIGDGNYYLARNRNNGEWQIGKCLEFAPGGGKSFDYWPWTPPTLPKAEPVPEVPKWLGCVRCKETGDFLFVTDIKNKTLTGVASNRIGYYSTPMSFYELYNHPEVPNSAELVAALKGAQP